MTDRLTERDFRRMALALDGAVEGAHMGHPDFRAHGRIFATLHQDRTSGMVKLTPDQQRRFVTMSVAFAPENGAWGRSGCTRVTFADVDVETVGEALTLAWQNAKEPRPATSRRPAQAGPSRRSSVKKKAVSR